MTAPHIVDPAGLLGEALAEASPDLAARVELRPSAGQRVRISEPNAGLPL